jgi:peptidoglycan hydrolase-like protein with peptidoglycan-binding domain
MKKLISQLLVLGFIISVPFFASAISDKNCYCCDGGYCLVDGGSDMCEGLGVGGGCQFAGTLSGIGQGSACSALCTPSSTSPITPLVPQNTSNDKPTPVFNTNLEYSSRGEEVKNLQQTLYNLKYMSVSPTGYYGAVTKGAVCNFQVANKILTANDPYCGIFGPKTRTTLTSVLSGKVLGATTTQIYSYGMRSPDLVPFQQKLIEKKYLVEGGATGNYLIQTFNAVKAFQAASGLTADGILGPATQTKLMDGSTLLSGPEYVCAAEKWTKKSDFIGFPVSFATAFSIGNYGYIGGGQKNNLAGEKSFWEYNPLSNSWERKSDYGGYAKRRAAGFAIGDKGYLGLNAASREFWEWNQQTDKWTEKLDFASHKRDFTVSFSIGNKGYVGMGGIDIQGYTDPVYKDFWEFDPTSNGGSGTWTQKADYGGGSVTKAVGFSIGHKGYVGTGILVDYQTSTLKKDFWEYDPSTNIWSRKADFGGGNRFHAVGFSIGNKGYVGTGRESAYPGILYHKDFWEYDPITDSWARKLDFGGKPRLGAVGFSIGGRGYLGTGQGVEGQANNYIDFWEYCPGASN